MKNIFAWAFLLGVVTLGANARSEAGESGFKEITIVTWQSSSKFRVVVADTPEKWSRGLVGSQEPSDGTGFLFLFPDERVVPFSMKGTDFGADVLLIDAAGQIVEIYKELSDELYHASPKPVLGLLFLKEGLSEKLEISEGCLVISSDNILVARGISKNEEAHRELAKKKLLSGAKLRPNDDATQSEVGEFYLGIGETEGAKKFFDKALDIKESARAHIGLGLVLGNNSKFNEAELHLMKAIELEPLNMDAYAKLIKLKSQTHGQQSVIDLLRKRVDEYPDSLEINRQLALLYLETNDLDAAEETIQSCIVRFDEKGQAKLTRVMGDVHLRKGNMLEAAEAYMDFLSVFPNAPHSQELRTFVLVHKVKKNRAEPIGGQK